RNRRTLVEYVTWSASEPVRAGPAAGPDLSQRFHRSRRRASAPRTHSRTAAARGAVPAIHGTPSHRELRILVRLPASGSKAGAGDSRLPRGAARAGRGLGGRLIAGFRAGADRRVHAWYAARLAPRRARLRAHRRHLARRRRAHPLPAVSVE